jgi:hypothetical protein
MDLDDDISGDPLLTAAPEDDEDELLQHGDKTPLYRKYTEIGKVLSEKMETCRTLNGEFSEMHLEDKTSVSTLNAFNEYRVTYLSMMQMAEQVIRKVLAIAQKRMNYNDEFRKDILQTVQQWSLFIASVKGDYNSLECFFESDFESDAKEFLNGRDMNEIITTEMSESVREVQNLVVDTDTNDESDKARDSDSLFKCTTNVQDALYAYYVVEEIIRLIQRPDMLMPSPAVTFVSLHLDTNIRTHVEEINTKVKSLKETLKWHRNEFIVHMPTKLEPIYMMIQFIAFVCMLVHQKVLENLPKTDKIQQMQEHFQQVC